MTNLLEKGIAEAKAAIAKNKEERYPHTNESACECLREEITSLRMLLKSIRRRRSWRDSEKAMFSAQIRKRIDALLYAIDSLS